MIVCPACGHRNPPTQEECQACGSPLEGFLFRVCPGCGALNSAENAFCSFCLTPLVELPSAESTAPAAGFAQEAPREGEPAPSEQASPKEEEKALPSPEGGIHSELEREPPEEPFAQEETISPSLPSAIPDDRFSLEEIEELLPASESVFEPPIPRPSRPEGISEEEAQQALLWERIAQREIRMAETARVQVPRQAEVLSRRGRILLYLLVLLAALLPTIIPPSSLSGLEGATARPSVISLQRAIASLGPEERVLLVFDYNPGYASEIEPLARSILTDLASQSVPSIALATKAAGTGNAQKVFASVSARMPSYIYGRDYVVLGYLPGQDAGLRALLYDFNTAFRCDLIKQEPLSAFPLLREGLQLKDISAIFVLSDSEQTVRMWVEQVGNRTHVPVHALVTSWAMPMLAPYYESGQLASLISSSNGALEYQLNHQNLSARLTRSTAYAGLVVVTLIIAIGTNISALITHVKRRHRGS